MQIKYKFFYHCAYCIVAYDIECFVFICIKFNFTVIK